MRPVTATYRVQFGGEVTFDRAAALAPYLARLGVSHLYASPVWAAREGSTHGYDVTDYNALRPSLGGREGFERMVAALREHELGVILDIVPNHMAASPENPWLADVMRHGQASEHAAAFDIDWAKNDRLVLPVLGAPLADVMAADELSVIRDDALGPSVAYYDKRFPLRLGTEDGEVADVLGRQAFELSYWRDLERLNYRRFFDITDLIGVRMEDEGVFERAHALLRDLIGQGLIDGVRVDHVDGMRDPGQYLRRLAGLFPDPDDAPVWVEKILEGDERMPAPWPIRGETGYAALAWLDGVFVDRTAEAPLTELYEELTGDGRSFDDVVHRAKREVIEGPFAHEFAGLAQAVAEAAGVTPGDAREVVEEVARAFPVYRTYLPESGEAERLRAFAAPAAALPAFDPVMTVLSDPDQPTALSFQQMTGPVTAKAVEDTSFYRWHRWAVLNEVGGEPARFGRTVDDFHAWAADRAAAGPQALSATATHDTKRGEDTRARLIAATHRPADWAGWAHRWWKASEEARDGISPMTAYLLFQCAVGFWEEGAGTLSDRLAEYALKAARERKRDTSWTEQDEEYEALVAGLARATCEGDLAAIVREAAGELAAAALNVSVARAVLKSTISGVPDTYQGTEAQDFSLVDPDNRRAVDWNGLAPRLASGEDRKLAATTAALRLRRAHPAVFGDYAPVDAPEGVLAFTRKGGGERLNVAVAIVPSADLPDLLGEAVLADPAARLSLG